VESDGIKIEKVKEFQRRVIKVMMGIIYFDPELIIEGVSEGVKKGFYKNLLISVLTLMNISKILTVQSLLDIDLEKIDSKEQKAKLKFLQSEVKYYKELPDLLTSSIGYILYLILRNKVFMFDVPNKLFEIY
jgi:hypothetical protein